jgi:UDP-N-acetylmuramoylalanine--D-glutamate ligase
MTNYKQYFKGKKITCMGLGLLGRGVGDAAFLAECGAELIITDLKTEVQLASSIDKLKKYKNIKFTLGEHKLEDFRDRDMILKSAGVPIDSIYITEARKNNIPVEMSASLFAELSGVPVIGVTGTRGKSTTTYMIEHILKTAGKNVLLGGNVRGVSTLELLKKTDGVDYAVFELDSWQLQGFGDRGISPHVSVFTTFYSDHLNYYKSDLDLYFSDKAKIFINQKAEDFLIVGAQAMPSVSVLKGKIKAKVVVPESRLPQGLVLNIPGIHNEYNAMLAVSVARCLKIADEEIKKALVSFTAVEGRLELLLEVRGVKIYNDNNSTTPEATMVALQALGGGNKKNIVLIMGGADKKLDMTEMVKEVYKNCKAVVMLPGTGSDSLIVEGAYRVTNLQEAVNKAVSLAEVGDTILFSPAFTSFGLFVNEYDRNDQFVALIKGLK